MKENKKLLAYLMVFGIGILLTLLVFISRKNICETNTDIVKVLSDAFLVPAALFCGLGGLAFASNQSFFGMFMFAMKRVKSHITHNNEFRKRYRDYYEYYEESRKHKAPYQYVLLPGIVFMAFAVVFNVLFNFI